MPLFGSRCQGLPLVLHRLRTTGNGPGSVGLVLLAVALVAAAALTRLAPRVLAASGSTLRPEPAASAQATPAAEAPPLVRVLIRQQTSLAVAAAASPLRLADGQGRSLGEIAAEQPFELRQDQTGLVVVMAGADGRAVTLGPLAGELWIVPLPAAGRSALVTVEGQLYRGRLQVRPGNDGRLLVINQLPLERYLPSVVGSEMPASWPQAALRAQAVAARTYALSQLKPSALFDLKATVDSQMYRGVASETDSTRDAVVSTRSQVLMQGRSLINAVFHSSSGGSTENSGEVWSRQLPYLVSVPDFDERSPVRQWQQRIEPEQLRRVFRETAGVSRIDVLAVSRTGRIRRARVSGPAGSLELSGAELRQRLGLRSTLVKGFRLVPVAGSSGASPASPGGGAIAQALVLLQPAAGPGRAPGAKPVAVPTNVGPVATPARPGVETEEPLSPAVLLDSATGAILSLLAPAPSAQGATAAIKTGAIKNAATKTAAVETAAVETAAVPNAVVPAEAVPAEAVPAAARQAELDRSTPSAAAPPQPALELVVEGRGFGHGVGMSQWGAYAMALQGRSYDQILRHYYRGVDLKPYVTP